MAQDDVLRFAERVIALVDTGRKSATYKLAALLALMDVTAARTGADGDAPDVVSAIDVADRVIELYWPQTLAWDDGGPSGPRVLSQSPQNDIPAKLAAFRTRHRLLGSCSLNDAEAVAPEAWHDLRTELRAIVLGMPLAKLQRFGGARSTHEERFIYQFSWREELSAGALRRPGFDDTLRLEPDVGDWLIRLSPLLRPLIQAKWAERVARRNEEVVGKYHLDEFLFGATRVSLDRVRRPLLAAQAGLCFYCSRPVGTKADVDHFLPWSRHPENALDNLVATDPGCNSAKSASIAAHPHLET